MIEPALHSDATDILPCGCVICHECRAARALHFRRPEWLESSLNDTDLQRVISGWSKLPEAMRTTVMVLVDTVVPQAEGSSAPAEHCRRDLDEIAWRLARDCRQIVQGCLREEEWQDADQEFLSIIAAMNGV